MQKYDDFGRPIYETAEEYNRAHRTGAGVNAHDNMEGESYKQNAPSQSAARRHATREGSKKAKTLVIGLVSFIIAINIVIILFAFNAVGVRYEEAIPEPMPEQDEDYYTEFLGDTEHALPTGFETFIYNGDVFTLPVQYSEFAKRGYYIEDYDAKEMVPAGFYEVMFLYEDDGWGVAQISVSNDSNEEKPLEECVVEYIYIYNPVPYDEEAEPTDFVFGEGFSFDSNYEDLESYLGVLYYHYREYSDDDYHYDSYEWAYYGDDENHYVMINFVNGAMSDISIEKDVW